MDRSQDAFQALILREVMLAEGLLKDLERAKLADWLGQKLSQPAAIALSSLVRLITKGRLSLPPGLTKQAIISFFKENGSLYSLRIGRAVWSRLFRDREHTAHSYCRTALCYAVLGKYDKAESWLKSAEERVNDLARPTYIRGLMLGAQGQLDEAEKKLTESLQGRAKEETKKRIAEAIETLNQLKQLA